MHENESLRDKLNRETAKVVWKELEKAFAQGRVLIAHDSLDLIEVAVALSEDDVSQVGTWMEMKCLGQVVSSEASDWSDKGAVFWAVVIAPWVLIQKISQKNKARNT